MKCIECDCCHKGYFESQPDKYVCIGVKEPFVIPDVNEECYEYPEKRTGYVKHKYLRELFPDGDLPFPYGEEDCADFDERDTFNLDNTLIAWLYERLRYFQDEASKIIDFEQPLYMYGEKVLLDGEETTQLKCIDRMVEDCKTILLYDGGANFDDWREEEKYFADTIEPAKDDLFMVLSKVYWAMWW